MEKRIIVIGAGPTGLAAGYRLRELNYGNWKIYEKNSCVGGLSASFKDPQGFTWDQGGHVIFSHFKYFDELFEKLTRGKYSEHMRESWIWVLDRFVPYPFQNNIRYLPKEVMVECLLELVVAQRNGYVETRDFKEWIIATFGRGIAKYFMLPYNFKVWSTPLELMDKNWIGERVSLVDVPRVLKNVLCELDDIAWGPNNKFKFPLHGGIGSFFTAFLPYVENNLELGRELVGVSLEDKTIRFSDGSTDHFEALINTAPIDRFVSLVKEKNAYVIRAAKQLVHNSGFIVGIGIRKPCPSTKCWIYFPESNSPFYRVTYFSNYSPYNVPGEGYYSLMCETSHSAFKPISKPMIIDETIHGLINSRMITENDRNHIVSTHLIELDYCYPVPTLDRDKMLGVIQPFLMSHDIYSRGRFGAWKYETANTDHSVMMGVEVVDRILRNQEETVFQC